MNLTRMSGLGSNIRFSFELKSRLLPALVFFKLSSIDDKTLEYRYLETHPSYYRN